MSQKIKPSQLDVLLKKKFGKNETSRRGEAIGHRG
jgi:hypothetical protein